MKKRAELLLKSGEKQNRERKRTKNGLEQYTNISERKAKTRRTRNSVQAR
jgi:hypothetical protein